MTGFPSLRHPTSQGSNRFTITRALVRRDEQRPKLRVLDGVVPGVVPQE